MKIIKVMLISIFVIISILFLFRDDWKKASGAVAKKGMTMNTYPFELTTANGNYTIEAGLESEELYPKYYDFFAKHGYEGNGECWTGHIIQILEKKDAELLEHIEFDPEAGGFYAYADSEESQRRFVSVVSPIFSDLAILEEYVAAADRSRIDD